MLDDNKSKRIILEIGIFLLGLSIFLFTMGIVMFFDHSFLVTANVLFLLRYPLLWASIFWSESKEPSLFLSKKANAKAAPFSFSAFC